MKISFSERNFILHPDGVLLWPKHNLLIVSDLHLEKSSHFARKGYLIPPYETHSTLSRLLNILKQTNLRRVLVLGDCFHDAGGFSRMSDTNRILFRDLQTHQMIWIAGNHDQGFVPDGIAGHTDFHLDGIVFRHEALEGQTSEISGHFHPKATIPYKGALVSRACFIEDGHKMILPAFGDYTGGLDVSDHVISDHFPKGGNLHLIGQDRIYSIPNPKARRSLGGLRET